MEWKQRGITVYVRNKQRYDPSSKLYDFLHVIVRNYAQTTIGAIKEDAIRQTGNSARINDLFLNNKPLADDRSVAHYNIEDGTILETTSNPFWATCIYIKKCEADKELAANPNDPHVLAWTKKSIPRKLTLLSVLFNSKNEFRAQPPHFPTLDDFVLYLERLNKKGATMNPHFTQKDLRVMHNDFLQNDVGRSGDPLGSFIRRYAIQLGFRRPDDPVNQNRGRTTIQHGGRAVQNRNNAQQVRGQRQVARGQRNFNCGDCEVALAELYCSDCQNATDGHGLYLCRQCSDTLHSGAARRRHQVDNLENAPKISAPYVPHAFKAPFSILVAMYRALRERPAKLSMTEEEIKERAQPLTDTDLQDKQTGQYCAGFDCMEKLLMMRGFVQREDARNPTYALTDLGEELAERLFTFQQAVQRFMMSNHIPQIPQSNSQGCYGGKRICLIVDEQERDKERLLSIARERNINVQVRQLGAGDYIWIMTPPQDSQNFRCMDRNNTEEIVLPYIVERKSWEDLRESVRTKRFYKQINNMLGSGIENCFYLLEGSMGRMRYKPSEEQQKKLRETLETIFIENGFYVNYTASWYKSVVWLLWVTALLNEMLQKGQLSTDGVPYSEFRSRTIGQSRNPSLQRTDYRPGNSHVWDAEHYIDGLFRDSVNEISLLNEVKSGMKTTDRNKKHVLVIEGLESYNKRRQSILNKCLNLADKNMETTPIPDTVKDHLGPQLHNMLHYDIMSYWQLRLQVMLNIYVVRTEKKEDTAHIQERVRGVPPNDSGSSPFNVFSGHGRRLDNVNQSSSSPRGNNPGRKRFNSSGAKDRQTDIGGDRHDVGEQLMVATDSQTEEFMIQQAIALSKQESRCNSNSAPQSRSGRGRQLPSATITAPTTEERVDRSCSGFDERGGDDDLQRVLKLSLLEAQQNQTQVIQTKQSSDITSHPVLDMDLVRQSRIQKLDSMTRNKSPTKKAAISKNRAQTASSSSLGVETRPSASSSLCQPESMEDSQDLNCQEQIHSTHDLNYIVSRDYSRIISERNLDKHAVDKGSTISGGGRLNKSMEVKRGQNSTITKTSNSNYTSSTGSPVTTTNLHNDAQTDSLRFLRTSSSDPMPAESHVIPTCSKNKTQSTLPSSDSQDEDLQYALKLSLQDQGAKRSDKYENDKDREVADIHVNQEQDDVESSLANSNIGRTNSCEDPVESIEILDSQSQDYEDTVVPVDVNKIGDASINIEADISNKNSQRNASSSENSEVITIDSQDSQDLDNDAIEEFYTSDNENQKDITEPNCDVSNLFKDSMNCEASNSSKKPVSALDKLYMEHLLGVDSQPDPDDNQGNVLVQDSQDVVVSNDGCQELDDVARKPPGPEVILEKVAEGKISVEESVPDSDIQYSTTSVHKGETTSLVSHKGDDVENGKPKLPETENVVASSNQKSTDIVSNRCAVKDSVESMANTSAAKNRVMKSSANSDECAESTAEDCNTENDECFHGDKVPSKIENSNSVHETSDNIDVEGEICSDTDSQVDCIPPSPESNINSDLSIVGRLANLPRKLDKSDSNDHSRVLDNPSGSGLHFNLDCSRGLSLENERSSGCDCTEASTMPKDSDIFDNVDTTSVLHSPGNAGINHDHNKVTANTEFAMSDNGALGDGPAESYDPQRDGDSSECEVPKRREFEQEDGQQQCPEEALEGSELTVKEENKLDSEEYEGENDLRINKSMNAGNEMECENSQTELFSHCDQNDDNQASSQSKVGTPSTSDIGRSHDGVEVENSNVDGITGSGNDFGAVIQLNDSESLVTFGNDNNADSLPPSPCPVRESTDSLPSIEDSQDFSPSSNCEGLVSLDDSEDLPSMDWFKSRRRNSLDLTKGGHSSGHTLTTDLLTMGNSSTSLLSSHSSVVCHARIELSSNKDVSTSRLSFTKSHKETNKTSPAGLTVSSDICKEQPCSGMKQKEMSDQEYARLLQRQLDMEYENEKKKRQEASSNIEARSTRSKRNARKRSSDDVVVINEVEATVGNNRSRTSGRAVGVRISDDVIVCDDAMVDNRSRGGSAQQDKHMVSSAEGRINHSARDSSSIGGSRDNNIAHRKLQGERREGQGYDEDLDKAIALSLQDVKQTPDSRNRLDMMQQRHGRKRAGSSVYDDPPVKVPCSVNSTRTSSPSPSQSDKSVPSHSATSNMAASDSGIVGTPWYKKLFAADSSNKAKLESQKQLQRVREQQNEKYQSQKTAPRSSLFDGKCEKYMYQSQRTAPRSSLFDTKYTAASWPDSCDDVVQLDSEGYLMYDKAATCSRPSHRPNAGYDRNTQIRSQPSCSSSLIGQTSSNQEWKFSSSPRKDICSSSAIGQSSSCKDWSFESKDSVLAKGKEEGNSTLTQSESLSKTKCGNCKMIGHKRTWEKCPYYFSLEEVKRRQEQADKNRERIEAKERADQEVKDNLEQHHKRLANIAAAITAEKERVEGTIQSIDKRKKVREKQRSKRGRR